MYDTDKTRRGNQPALSHALALNVSYVVQQSVLFLDPPLQVLCRDVVRMWIIKIFAYFSIVPFYTVQNSGFQIIVDYQVVVCQLQTNRLYPYRLYTSRRGQVAFPTVRYSDSSIFRQFDIPKVGQTTLIYLIYQKSRKISYSRIRKYFSATVY